MESSRWYAGVVLQAPPGPLPCFLPSTAHTAWPAVLLVVCYALVLQPYNTKLTDRLTCLLACLLAC